MSSSGGLTKGFALFGVMGLAAVVLVHEIAEVFVTLNGLRIARTRNVVSQG